MPSAPPLMSLSRSLKRQSLRYRLPSIGSSASSAAQPRCRTRRRLPTACPTLHISGSHRSSSSATRGSRSTSPPCRSTPAARRFKACALSGSLPILIRCRLTMAAGPSACSRGWRASPAAPVASRSLRQCWCAPATAPCRTMLSGALTRMPSGRTAPCRAARTA